MSFVYTYLFYFEQLHVLSGVIMFMIRVLYLISDDIYRKKKTTYEYVWKINPQKVFEQRVKFDRFFNSMLNTLLGKRKITKTCFTQFICFVNFKCIHLKPGVDLLKINPMVVQEHIRAIQFFSIDIVCKKDCILYENSKHIKTC